MEKRDANSPARLHLSLESVYGRKMSTLINNEITLVHNGHIIEVFELAYRMYEVRWIKENQRHGIQGSDMNTLL